MLKTTYTYDAKGRVIRTESQTHLGGLETENLTYSFMDEVLTRNLVHTDATGQSSNELYTYTYDHWGRPLQTIHQLGSGNGVILHDNVYDGIGRLMADNRCGALSLPTSYAYNVRSWLMGIQSDLFCEVMSYEAPGTGITSRWGGNISQIVWRSGAETNSRKYAFTYDGYGRLAGAAYSSLRAGDYSTSYAYDANSNLTSITRMAIEDLHGGGAFIPGGIGYILSGNQVALRLQGSSGFNAMAMTANASGADFRQVYYDACGRMVRDDYQGIGKITYNELHLPATIQRVVSGYSSVKYGVQYAADGRKLRTGRLDSAVEPTFNGTNDSLEDASEASVELTESIPIINAGIDDGRREREPLVSFITTTDYVGNLVYKDGILEKVLVDGGFITAADMRYHFFVTDHLGNVRVVVNDAGVVEQVNQFYPYGESIELDPASANPGVETITENPYKWGGKEWDEEQGAYDFGARMYSASDARWTTMDPLCEKYYSISPYSYCAGNPVCFVDVDGRVPRVYVETNGLGHTFVTVGEGVNTVVYTYGRYGALGSSGSILHSWTPTGEGVLKKLTGESALEYIGKEIGKGNLSFYEITQAEDNTVSDYFDDQWESGTNRSDPEEKVVDTYGILTNNCTTKSIEGINSGSNKDLVPTTTTTTQVAASSPAVLSTTVPIVSPKQFKPVLDAASKAHPQDIIKVADPQEFFRTLMAQFGYNQ